MASPESSATSSCGAWIMHEGPCVLAKGHDGHHSDGRPEDRPAYTAFFRLRRWSRDELHAGKSAHFHQPVYANPAELRADVRLVLDEFVKAGSK